MKDFTCERLYFTTTFIMYKDRPHNYDPEIHEEYLTVFLATSFRSRCLLFLLVCFFHYLLSCLMMNKVVYITNIITMSLII